MLEVVERVAGEVAKHAPDPLRAALPRHRARALLVGEVKERPERDRPLGNESRSSSLG
jgi:hypothetical protein